MCTGGPKGVLAWYVLPWHVLPWRELAWRELAWRRVLRCVRGMQRVFQVAKDFPKPTQRSWGQLGGRLRGIPWKMTVQVGKPRLMMEMIK